MSFDWKRAVGRLRKTSGSALSFLKLVIRQFNEDRCPLNAAALTLSTLGALVPLAAVTLSFLTTFPAFEGLGQQLQNFIFENFVPATGEAIQEHLNQFVSKASEVQFVGTIFLIVTVLLLIALVDGILNDIWQVERRRSGTRAFLLYWTLLTLGPILLGLSIGLSSYFVSAPLISAVFAEFTLPAFLHALLPLIISVIALTFLYNFVPNRQVNFFHAAAGALAAAVVFELTKRGFAFYIKLVPTYEVVYGTLAALPIFLLWLYLSWSVVLLGAEIAFCLSIFPHSSSKTPPDRVFVSLQLIWHVWRAHLKGKSLNLSQIASLEPEVSTVVISETLRQLEDLRLVGHLPNEGYFLKKDLRDCTIADLYRSLPWKLPGTSSGKMAQSDGVTARFREILEDANQALSDSLDVPLQELFEEESSETAVDG